MKAKTAVSLQCQLDHSVPRTVECIDGEIMIIVIVEGTVHARKVWAVLLFLCGETLELRK